MALQMGAFSEKAAKLHGSTIWLKPDGVTEVEVTTIVESMESYKRYNFPDKHFMGIVTKYVRKGRDGEQAGP